MAEKILMEKKLFWKLKFIVVATSFAPLLLHKHATTVLPTSALKHSCVCGNLGSGTTKCDAHAQLQLPCGNLTQKQQQKQLQQSKLYIYACAYEWWQWLCHFYKCNTCNALNEWVSGPHACTMPSDLWQVCCNFI